jgi:hypothetical protein
MGGLGQPQAERKSVERVGQYFQQTQSTETITCWLEAKSKNWRLKALILTQVLCLHCLEVAYQREPFVEQVLA